MTKEQLNNLIMQGKAYAKLSKYNRIYLKSANRVYELVKLEQVKQNKNKTLTLIQGSN